MQEYIQQLSDSRDYLNLTGRRDEAKQIEDQIQRIALSVDRGEMPVYEIPRHYQ